MSQACASCSAANADGAKFCNECGSPMARACPGCGATGVSGKFCNECGTPLSSAAPPPAAAPAASGPVSERRTTSVLFGDLVSFTTISEARDPEEVRELLSAYFAVARTVVGRYGGTIEKFIGDAVMAVWGVPVAHEDDAERAVRAGLDLVAEVTALGDSVGVPDLAMRVGIVTGSVAVTLGATNEGMVAGDAVNTAARVQSAADPTTVWVDTETRSLTAAAVAYTDMGEHTMKGKAEPARLFRADAIVAARGGAQRVDGLEAPMTGRDAELRRVKELFHATEGDGRARIALVTGVAGVGKSRLGWEFEKYVDGLTTVARWHRGRCLSYGDGVAFWAFAEMVRSRLKVLETDDRSEIEVKVREGVAAVATDPTEAAWLTPRVHALLSGRDGSTFDRTDLFTAWTTYLERVADGHPLILLFEDMQHADSGLLDLVEHLLETSRTRLFVLVLTRSELLEQRPSLATGRRAEVLELTPLDDGTMGSLVDALVAALPTRARTALVSRAEGVPLYAVETVRSLIDRDAVQAQDGRYVYVDLDGSKVDLDQLAAPTSLQTLIAARLDALTPVERRTVQDASVLGLSFRHSGLMKLSDVSSFDLDKALDGLVRKGVIEPQSDPRSPELGSYRFLQALVREVAYSTLARKDRKTRHLAAADHLEGEGEGAADTLAGIIAQHLLDALGASSATDPDRPETSTRARALLTAASSRAEALGSPNEALRTAMSALDLEPGPEETVGLQERAARMALLAGEPTRAEPLAAVAAAGHRDRGNEVAALRITATQAWALMGLGRQTEALELAETTAASADTRDDVPAIVHLELASILVRLYRSQADHEGLQRAALRALRLAEELGEPAALVQALNNVALMLVEAGGPTAYLALLQRSVELAREGHLLAQLGRSLSNILAEVYPADLNRAAELAEEAIAVTKQVGDSNYIETALANCSFVWLLNGEWDRLLREALAWLEGKEVTLVSSTTWSAVAAVRAARGEPAPEVVFPDSEDAHEVLGALLVSAHRDPAQADLSHAARAAAATRELYGSGGGMDDFEMLWGPAVEVQLRMGELDEAASLLTLAAPLLGGRSRPLLRGTLSRLTGLLAIARGQDPEADLRAAESAFAGYGAVFSLARTRLELGRWLLQQGREAEADPLLQLARPVFVQLKAAPSLAELDALRQPVGAA